MFNRSLLTIIMIAILFTLIGCLTGDSHTVNTKEVTLSIIKPDAVKNNHIGEIISRFEKNNLRVAAIKMVQLNKNQAEEFYEIHKERPFYKDLVQFMTSGPVVLMVLEGDQAIKKNREIMGATDPKDANEGTIRKDFATNIEKNAIHGSDSSENAKKEINFFFSLDEINTRYAE